MNWLAWAGIVVALAVALLGGYFGLMGQRSQAQSQQKVAQLAADGTAGQLALALAQNSQGRLAIAEQKVEQLETWEDDVQLWWDLTDLPWHRAVEAALGLCNCHSDVLANIPNPTPIPRRKRYQERRND